MAPANGRAQATSALALIWHGPSGCAEPTGVLESARELGGGAADGLQGTLHFEVQELADGLRVTFDADLAGRTARRELTVTSCDDARRAAALLVAMALGTEPEPPTLPPATDAPATKSSAVAPEPAASPRAPEPAASPRQHTTAASVDRSFVTAWLAGGAELPALSSAMGLLAARVGWRSGALAVEAGPNLGLPARADRDGVTVAVAALGGAAAGCHWFTFGRWELAPCLGVEVARVSVEIDGQDAGSAPWLRAASGPRVAWWFSDGLALSAAVDGVLALHRPRFAAASRVARPPAASFTASIGIAAAFGRRSLRRAPRP